MKYIIIIFFLVFTISSCNDDLQKEINEFCKSVIENPDLIYHLKETYPNFYDDNFIYSEIMKSEKALNRIHQQLNKFFKKNSDNLMIKQINLDNTYLEQYKKFGYNLSIENVNEFALCRDNFCLSIMIIKVDQKYKLFYIETSVYDPYKEGF